MPIAPVLRVIAQKLRYSEYYILQSFSGNRVLTTLSHKTNPQIEKQVIFPFPRLQDFPYLHLLGLTPRW
jgi:hypothetical protein